MSSKKSTNNNSKLFSLAKPYFWFIICILIVSLFSNGISLIVPKIIATVIDTFRQPNFNLTSYLLLFLALAVLALIFSAIQSILQTYLSEKIGRDLRTRLITKISQQPFSFIVQVTPEKLLTNLTADIDNIKMAISQGLVQIFSSAILLIGSTALLLSINVKLALMVLVVVPLIATIFFLTFKKIHKYFIRSQVIIDKLNKTINESIVASSLIRIVNSQSFELKKFETVSGEAKSNGLSILKLFSALIPLIGIITNITTVAILLIGGKSIVAGTFSVGSLQAFLSYLSLLIFPILILGFISNILARAGVSFERVSQVLNTQTPQLYGDQSHQIKGGISFKKVNLSIGNKQILKNISFEIKAHSKTALLGPTAAGKTQILYLLSGLLPPTSGQILIDNIPLADFSQKSLSDQIGLVFQDSSIFNTTIMENINFKNVLDQSNIDKAINTAELGDFIKTLPNGLNTKIAERGNNLSGGQKQRITLARALALNPKILLLDDFTARVDKDTENKIFANVAKNYSNLTQILITQQISSVVNFDQIILFMEGEVLATGTHQELLKSSKEYQQIYNSQMSTT
ncbi:MAG: ABC transporter ATP-binding protein [Candidatus Shapirobacteria bacterium]|nr:ABC transporter ATP-binding protein [Candidatus Shapirobacteria bacterium]MDD4410138.1 ABC transporter ATP-binding protein [Candidatus Shapirobacteria bacterium]